MSMSRPCGCVRCCRLGSVGRECPRLCLLWEVVHPICRHYTPSDRVHCDVTGVAPLVRSRASMSKLCRSVRGGRLGSVGANCPRLCLLREAVHPIRRHYTPSDRVHRDGSGVSRRNGCSASRADLVLQAWSASVTDPGSGRGAAWTPPMLTAPAREPEPRASPAQQGCAEGQQTIGEGPKPCGSGPSHCCATGAIIAWVL